MGFGCHLAFEHRQVLRYYQERGDRLGVEYHLGGECQLDLGYLLDFERHLGLESRASAVDGEGAWAQHGL